MLLGSHDAQREVDARARAGACAPTVRPRRRPLGLDGSFVRLDAYDAISRAQEAPHGVPDPRDRPVLARQRREGLDGRHGIDAGAAGLVGGDRSVADLDPGHEPADRGRVERAATSIPISSIISTLRSTSARLSGSSGPAIVSTPDRWNPILRPVRRSKPAYTAASRAPSPRPRAASRTAAGSLPSVPTSRPRARSSRRARRALPGCGAQGRVPGDRGAHDAPADDDDLRFHRVPTACSTVRSRGAAVRARRAPPARESGPAGPIRWGANHRRRSHELAL